MSDAPRVVIIGGPNGAGKSTIAPRLLADVHQITEFVNADTIARGLSAFDPDRVAIQAGRIMLTRLKEPPSAPISRSRRRFPREVSPCGSKDWRRPDTRST